jgi:guanine deaminase
MTIPIAVAGPPELLRAAIFHTPRNAFHHAGALEAYADGGLLIRDGRVAACADFAQIRAAYPDVTVTDWRGGFLLPGLIDTHVHFPQVRVIGSLGRELLDWLEHCALPEESRMADLAYAHQTARLFVDALASHGTTTALVFGSHFAAATECLFEAADATGLRIASGLVLSDRLLSPDLHQTPDQAYRESTRLIRAFHGRGRLLYAVTPRFALSASEAMLDVCQTLLREHEGLRFQTHLNENREEVSQVARLFPSDADYLGVYERHALVGPYSVLAHNVHPTGSELERLASHGAAVAHCPASNAALGSGIFPLRSHLNAGVRFALGTDIGAGTCFSLLREGLQAYLMQRVAHEGWLLTAPQLLYLATRAGAEALQLEDEIGDFQTGKAADFVYLRPRPDSPLSAIADRAGELPRILAALFTLADRECVEEVRVEGVCVYKRGMA